MQQKRFSTILFIEDEEPIRDMVRFSLETEGFVMLEAGDAEAAQAVLATRIPDLILLDWMLPGKSGIEIAKRCKQGDMTRDIPIIMLTARASEDSKIQGFAVGVDDYIVKPFSPKELVARIRAVLRRGLLVSAEGILEFDQLRLDSHSHDVSIANQQLKLSPTEYQLLYFFMMHPERVYSREQLLNHVWGGEVYIDDRTVDVQIRRLRKALAKYEHDYLIQTVRGMGYKFSDKR